MVRKLLLCCFAAIITVMGVPSASEAYERYDIYTLHEGTDDVMKEAAQAAAPGTKATREEVQEYIKQSLNSGHAVDDNIHIKGRKALDDGKYGVAISYGSGNGRKNVTVIVDEAGQVVDANLDMTDEELQQAYDDIVYGHNEMTVQEICKTNDILHSHTDDYVRNAAESLGIDLSTAETAAAGGISLAGMVILGAGKTQEEKNAIWQRAQGRGTSRSGSGSGSSDSSGSSGSSGGSGGSAGIVEGPGVFNCAVSAEQYDGLTEPTKKFLDTLTASFYNATGITVTLTSAYRPGDSGSWHSAGIAFDVVADEFEGENGKYYRDLYGQIAAELGGTPLDEYPGEPGEIYARGSNFHVTVHGCGNDC